MTIPEKKNAAAFLEYTTAMPFISMGTSFRCFYCYKPYSEVPELIEHTVKHSIRNKNEIYDRFIPRTKRFLQVDISELKCRICDKKYSDLNAIREHLIKAHDKEFCKASNGVTEYRLETNNGMFVCHICFMEFPSFGLMDKHMHIHNLKVICEKCGQGFRNQQTLVKHNETHLTKTFDCKICDKRFFKLGQMKYHMKTSHVTKKRHKKKCPKCPETFYEQYSKMTHLREAHGIVKTFVCHVCKKEFSQRRYLSEHANRYHLERFKCEICSKCFGSEILLLMHKPVHTKLKMFNCTICRNKYKYETSLNYHLRNSHKNPKYKCICSECGAGFKFKYAIRDHIKKMHPSIPIQAKKKK